MSNEIKYTIVISAEGKPEVVEVTDSLEQQGQAVDALNKKLTDSAKLNNEVARTAVQLTQEELKNLAALEKLSIRQEKVLQETKALSTEKTKFISTESQIASTIANATEALNENTYHLESVRLEYESGEISAGEYVARLEELRNEIANQDAPLVGLVRRQREINREIQNVNTTTGLSTRNTYHAQRAMVAMHRALAAMPAGASSFSNALIPLISNYNLLDSAQRRSMSSMSVIKSFFAGGAGIGLGITLAVAGITKLVDHYDLLDKKSKEVQNSNEGVAESLLMISAEINKSLKLDSILDKRGLQSDLDLLNELTSEVQNTIDFIEKTRTTGTGSTSRTREESDEESLRLERLSNELIAIDEQILKTQARIDLIDRLNQSETLQRASLENSVLQMNELFKDSLSDFDEEMVLMTKDIASFAQENARLLQSEVDSMSEISLENRVKAYTGYINYEKNLEQSRIDAVKNSGDEIKALRMQLSLNLQMIDEDENASERQRLEARELMIEEFAQREIDIKNGISDQKKAMDEDIFEFQRQLDDHLTALKIDNAYLAVNAISAINQGLLGDSRAVAIGIFAFEKAMSIAHVLMAGARESTEVTLAGTKYLANPATWPIAGMHFAAAAKIKSQSYISAGMIGAMSLGEGAVQFSGGGSSGRSSGGPSLSASRTNGNSNQRREEFGIVNSTTQKEVPAIHLGVVIHNDISEPKKMALIVKEGNEQLASQTVRVGKNGN